MRERDFPFIEIEKSPGERTFRRDLASLDTVKRRPCASGRLTNFVRRFAALDSGAA